MSEQPKPLYTGVDPTIFTTPPARSPVVPGPPPVRASATVEITIDDRPVVARRGETILEACRAQGIDIPTLCQGDTVTPEGQAVVRESGFSCRRLIVAAVFHPDRIEHQRLHDLRKRLPGNVLDEKLQDLIAAARITMERPRFDIHYNRAGVCGLHAL